jgi:Cys-tRNA(Pro) deacylase
MENVLNKESVKRVDKVLKTFEPKLRVEVLNSSARTAIDAANSLKCEVGAIVKSLLLRADDAYVLCLVSGDKKCSLNKVKKITGKKDVCMANAEDVKKQTGFTIGGVSPVGLTNNLEIMIDNQLNRFQDIFAAAGHPNTVFKIDFKNLNKITKGVIVDISE